MEAGSVHKYNSKKLAVFFGNQGNDLNILEPI